MSEKDKRKRAPKADPTPEEIITDTRSGKGWEGFIKWVTIRTDMAVKRLIESMMTALSLKDKGEIKGKNTIRIEEKISV